MNTGYKIDIRPASAPEPPEEEKPADAETEADGDEMEAAEE